MLLSLCGKFVPASLQIVSIFDEPFYSLYSGSGMHCSLYSVNLYVMQCTINEDSNMLALEILA